MRTYAISARPAQPQPTAVRTASLPVGEIAPWLAATLGRVAGAVAAAGGHIVGPPFARYHRAGEGRFDVEAGFPVAVVVDSTEVQQSSLPGGPLAWLEYAGPYDAMGEAYEAVLGWVRERGELAGDPWEVYLTDPAANPDPATWRTDILAPYRPATRD